MSGREPRNYEPLAEPICQPVCGRHIVGSISRSKRVVRPFVGYRVICLRLDQVRRVYPTGWGPQRNKKCRLQVYETLSRRGDLVQHRQRATTDINSFLILFTTLYTLPLLSLPGIQSIIPTVMPSLPSIQVLQVILTPASPPWSRIFICICVGYSRTLPHHLYLLVIPHDIAPINTFPFTNKLSNK